ncbi:MAG: tetratricopeptide repeat protein [Spirochaetes bacterium]|nr:tetratricopeptide repeat protein [Spirochaetota bacterium]
MTRRSIGSFRTAALAIILSIGTVASPGAQGDAPPDEPPDMGIVEKAYGLMDSGDYGGAVVLLEQAKESYPDSAPIRIELAGVFYDREFYELAAGEYEAAARIDPGSAKVWFLLSDCYGRLNREEDSITALERTLMLEPDNLDAIGELGWMRYKVHELEAGIKLLLDAAGRFGMNRGFAMTLGTLYSEIYDYAKAESYYRIAIDEATGAGDGHFAAIALYNLSLLDSAFHRFDEALAGAGKSIDAERRASGLLARGELRQRRQDFRAAFADYGAAFALDKTPLSRLDLADACLEAGRLEEALAYLDDVAKIRKHPWMVNFGINPESFSQALHDSYAEVCSGLANVEFLRPKRGFPDIAAGLFAAAGWKLLSSWHELLAGKAARAEADDYARLGNRRNADYNRYLAFIRYPGTARRYLESLAGFETEAVPESKAMYDLERAILDADPAMLQRALPALDPAWELDLVARGLSEAAGLLARRGDRIGLRETLERLYLVNRGSFRRNGFGLPVELRVRSADARFQGRLGRVLSASGMETARSGGESAFAYSLTVSVEGAVVAYELASKRTGAVLAGGKTSFASVGETRAPAIADFLVRSIHTVDR